jgi:hypothetical protein
MPIALASPETANLFLGRLRILWLRHFDWRCIRLREPDTRPVALDGRSREPQAIMDGRWTRDLRLDHVVPRFSPRCAGRCVVDVMNKSITVNNLADFSPLADYHVPEIDPLAEHSHVKRVPREPEPPEEAVRPCEGPESRLIGKWEAPDAGVDVYPSVERGLSRGRSRG